MNWSSPIGFWLASVLISFGAGLFLGVVVAVLWLRFRLIVEYLKNGAPMG